LLDIVSFNEDVGARLIAPLQTTSLLFFGRSDEDIFTYNPETQKYEARDITGFEVWDDYDTFEAFFKEELKDRFM
jgi:DNA topoisomerase VI subunit A